MRVSASRARSSRFIVSDFSACAWSFAADCSSWAIWSSTRLRASTDNKPIPGTLISSRQVGLCLTIARMALSKTAICSRSWRQAISIGRTINSRSVRSPSRTSTRRSKGRPRTAPGSRPNVLSTPRMWFDSRVVMPTSCDRAPNKARARWASSDFTCTDRYHPVRMICAKPSASFWSVLFICILSAALACRASRHTTSSARRRSSCTSHGVIEPVSMPMRASSPACWRTVCSISRPSGTGHARAGGRFRRQCRSKSSSVTHPIQQSGSSSNLRVRTTGRQRPDRGTIGGLALPRLPDVHTWHRAEDLASATTSAVIGGASDVSWPLSRVAGLVSV